MPAESPDAVAIDLIANLDQFNRTTKQGASQFGNEMQRIKTSADQAEKSVTQSMNRAGKAVDQASIVSKRLGLQIGQIGSQLAVGTSPFIIMAQQSSDIAIALDGAGGKLGKFIGFLGTWQGAVLLAAGTIAAQFLPKLLEAGDGVDALTDKIRDQEKQTVLNERANKLFDDSLEGLEKAARLAHDALQELENRQKTQEQQTVESIQTSLNHAKALALETQALLDAAEANNELYKGSLASTDPRIASQFKVSADRINALRDRLERANDQAVKLQKDLTVAISFRTVEEASRTSEEAINRTYDAQIEAARKSAVATGLVTTALKKQVDAINEARRADLERFRQAEEARRRAARDTSTTTNFLNPVGGGRISGTFDEPRPGHQHAGIDIAVPVGTSVKAAAGGTVIEAGTLPGYGNVVIIDHGGGTITRYAHLSQIGVAKNAIVEQGAQIGLSGGARGAPGAGNSQGPHLHYEVRVNGKPVDPRKGVFPTDELGAQTKAIEDARRAAEDELRRLQAFENERSSLQVSELQARRALLTGIDEIAQAQADDIELERKKYNANLASLVEQKKLTQDEADELIGINNERARLRQQLVERNRLEAQFRAKETERRQALDQADAQSQDQADILRAQEDLAATAQERREIESRLLELQYAEEKARNDYLISYYERLKTVQGIGESELSEARAAAQIAELRNRSLDERKGLARERLERSTPFGRYADSKNDPETAGQEAAVRELEALRQGMVDGLTKELGIKNQYIKDLLGIFLDQVLFRPIADALHRAESGNGAGGGIFGTILGAIGSAFGVGGLGGAGGGGKNIGNNLKKFASGGSFGAGQPFIAGESGPELIFPGRSGLVVSNRQLAAAGGGGGGLSVVRLELTGEIDARIQRVSGPVAVEVVRAAQPGLTNIAANETISRLGRPSL